MKSCQCLFAEMNGLAEGGERQRSGSVIVCRAGPKRTRERENGGCHRYSAEGKNAG